MSIGEDVLKLVERVRREHRADSDVIEVCAIAARWATARLADVERAKRNRDKARAKRNRERAAAAADRGGA